MRPPLNVVRSFAGLSLSFSLLGACGKREPPRPTEVATASSLRAEQRATLDGVVANAKARAKVIDDERHAAVEKVGTSAPRIETGACPVDFGKLVPADPSTSETTAGKRMLAAKRATWALTTSEIVQPGKPTNFRVAGALLERALSPVLERAAPGKTIYPPDTPDQVLADAAKIGKELDDAHDLAFVITELVDPVASGDSSFEPGRIAGVLYVWSRAKRAFVCATQVQGDGSGTVNVTTFKGMGKAETTASALHGHLLTSAVIGHLPKLAPLAR